MRCTRFEQKRSLTREEKELADLLTLLIENFEERRYQLPRATPRQALSFLMEQHALRQKDLLDIFGARSVVSEVLNGKRELTKEQIGASANVSTFRRSCSSNSLALQPICIIFPPGFRQKCTIMHLSHVGI